MLGLPVLSNRLGVIHGCNNINIEQDSQANTRTSSTSQPPKLTPRTIHKVSGDAQCRGVDPTFLRPIGEAGVDRIVTEGDAGQEAEGDEGERDDASEHGGGSGGRRGGAGETR